jgi:hypothetical protein
MIRGIETNIEMAAIDMAYEMVKAFHVDRKKDWSPDYFFNHNMKYWIFDFNELYLMAQVLFPVMLVLYVTGQPLMECK